MNNLLWVTLPFVAAAIRAFLTLGTVNNWYADLIKPAFIPPNALYGAIWIVLYALMSIAVYLIVKKGGKETKFILAVFAVQLFFNALWSVIFFGFKEPALACGVMVVLWYLIAYNVWSFYKINKTAGLLLTPYLAWVSFAGLLNYAIWQLNK